MHFGRPGPERYGLAFRWEAVGRELILPSFVYVRRKRTLYHFGFVGNREFLGRIWSVLRDPGLSEIVI